ncbi:MAG: CoA transferase, partial [Comamonadaceae bacterium]
MANETRALSGIKVCDLTQGVAGPHATMLLALHGADVTKIEPLEGDWCRVLGKPSGQETTESIAVNRAKRSIACNLKSDAGRDIVRRMIEQSDIFIESFRPGVIARMGLGYDEVRKIKPSIVYASVSGFGQEGPNTLRPTVDGLI